MLPVALVEDVFACLGKINMRQLVVTKAGLLIPEGLVGTDGAVRFPREDNIEWEGHVGPQSCGKENFQSTFWFYGIPFLSNKKSQEKLVYVCHGN